MKAILIGLLAALFFSVTFVLNRLMELEGGHWVWSASLRFMFMLPILGIILGTTRKIKPVINHIKRHPIPWFLWSTIGFGLFYAPLTFATIYGPGWLVAATFQLTIIAGSLLVPFLSQKVKQRIPIQSVFISLIILAGIFIMQMEHATTVPMTNVLLCVIPLVISAFAYPLGNRKMMLLVQGELTTFQRLLGMTIASMPFWIVLAVYGIFVDGLPSGAQVGQTFIVAVSSGIIATALFFYAAELVQDDNHKLAGVEATQSGEVIFALFGELLLLSAPLPSALSFIGIGLVIFGMLLHSVVSVLGNRKKRLIIKKQQSI
ncbi:multidrug resistance efflux transporter family protein [Virgibacillus halodenitrificans]|jgi:drug/metabolite transporter (DMT)-like permease|uniref:Multidrug resistance efflux transporter family protein n=1 Tax=Virgibacillus halodenitrificans TaxID=1482 RepID=A0ABR7VI73_VIRHA|nr:multidrug resistance efflux transporter family protein [Virgibacillus halodenitrificans]MBD1221638.1 multidrug resistance efflux transporter family protein [Virgibacillus halodenitrificans]MEC2160625.1 multidrug resistance efflux transporter family protein [Virgibacillus halodenitrificans]MYL46911.1 multidrug resistance efflux transporter family protein [Virgibacillus halodenitrificans]MYL57612.1 multidrug resistance efflux transporter family protein [Virgibacillus halodenitrificans]